MVQPPLAQRRLCSLTSPGHPARWHILRSLMIGLDFPVKLTAASLIGAAVTLMSSVYNECRRCHRPARLRKMKVQQTVRLRDRQ